MLHTAESIAQGDLSTDVDVASKDEVGGLAAAFQRMSEYLREMAGAATASPPAI